MDLDSAFERITARDRTADGSFVFAVTTTSIFCRPSCPARRPRRDHVRIFESNEEAQRAGFRPCLRCRPTELSNAALARAKALIESSEGERMTLAALGAAVGLSPDHLQRVFKREYGLSPARFAASLRQSRIRDELRKGTNVTSALYEAGYGSSSRLYESANAVIGMTPGAYRRGGAGMNIRYALHASSAGCILAAATPRGICAILLGDSREALVSSLQSEYPRATIEPADVGDATLTTTLAEVSAAIAGNALSANLNAIALDVPGTPFQQRVWSALREIPIGETRTYAELARAAGSPAAVRAAASACASNHVAIVIPCHRIVRGDGSIGGYRWGEARKVELLDRERRQ